MDGATFRPTLYGDLNAPAAALLVDQFDMGHSSSKEAPTEPQASNLLDANVEKKDFNRVLNFDEMRTVDTATSGVSEAALASGATSNLPEEDFRSADMREHQISQQQVSVMARFQQEFLLVQLYTDGGDKAIANQKMQISRFQTVALPFYVILDSDNNLLAKHAGILNPAKEFLQFLN